MKNPTYYVAIFGDPDPPEKDTVESGIYHLGIRGTDLPGEQGDIILLYCTGTYFEHYKCTPGIGVILSKDKEAIYYRYLPLSRPIARYNIEDAFNDEDRQKLSNIRFKSHWLFEITRDSFCNTIKNVSVNWP